MRIVKKKAVIAISGGLDSSAAAFLLQKQGYEVIGMFMRFGVAGQQDHEAVARRVCQKLNIKFYPINFIAKFKKEVIDYFLDSYARGLTPNPCVKCNQIIKFGFLLEQAKKIGADYLATGHYTKNAKCKMQNAKFIYKLFRGKDKDKDQGYFLYTLTQKQLAKILFPLGDYIKEEVRRIADKAKLLYLSRESQDVCFLSGEHNDFLKKHLKLKPGKIKTLNGKVVGEHQGLPFYTIGQRRGVEIGGVGPFYVVKCDYKTNTLYVVKDKDDPALYSDKLIAENVNWIAGREPALPLRCEAVIRYRHKPVECIVIVGTGHCSKKQDKTTGCSSTMGCNPLLNCNPLLIKFKKSQRAVTPGQSVVFYKGDEVLGGGIISNL